MTEFAHISGTHHSAAHGIMNGTFMLLSSQSLKSGPLATRIWALFLFIKAFYIVLLLQLRSQFIQPVLKILFQSQAFCSFFFRNFLVDVLFTGVGCVALKELFYFLQFIFAFQWLILFQISLKSTVEVVKV